MARSREEELERIARLAGLSLSEEEKDVLFSDLSRIVPYMERISQLDTSAVEAESASSKSTLRQDISEDSPLASGILKQAPESSDGMFSVPRVV